MGRILIGLHDSSIVIVGLRIGLRRAQTKRRNGCEGCGGFDLNEQKSLAIEVHTFRGTEVQ